MLTAGSGITPVMSMIRTLVPHRPDSDVVLIHSARTPADAIFREELAELADQFPNFRVIHWFTGERGRLDFSSDRRAGSSSARTGASAPPTPAARKASWTTPRRCGRRRPQPPEPASEATLTIERFSTKLAGGAGHDGGLVTFETSDREVEADGDTPLLDVGEDAGVLMPSGCRMGICHSCLIPLRAGQVRDLRTAKSTASPAN